MSSMDPELLAIRKERAKLLAEAIAEEHALTASSILGRGRDPQVVAQRHRLWRMLWDSGLSSNAIAQICEVDHSTVLYALRKSGLMSARRKPQPVKAA